MQYQENYGLQEQWTECSDIPLIIKPRWFIDVGEISVAECNSLKEAKKTLVHWPHGEIRRYFPTQEERKEELALNREMRQQISTFD